MDKLKIEGDELIKWLSDESVSKGAEWIKVNLYRYWYCGYRGIKFESYSKKYEEGEFKEFLECFYKQINESWEKLKNSEGDEGISFVENLRLMEREKEEENRRGIKNMEDGGFIDLKECLK